MPENIVLKLGDIIQIYAPNNTNYHDKKYYIQFMGEDRMELISEDGDTVETIQLDPETKQLKEESIENIYLLSHADNEGYAREHGLLPGKWIDLYFGGDVPTTITGRISNLEEDMIEISTYPDNQQIYIDFAYKDIPDDLPIDKILLREPPKHAKKFEEMEEGEELELENEDVLNPEKLKTRLEGALVDAEQIQFVESMGYVSETVNISESKKRFSLEKQVADLLDELLSTIPNSERTPMVMSNIYTMIERFIQLREEFSYIDKNGNVKKPHRKTDKYKPLVETLVSLNKNLEWILPVVKNRKILYDIDWDDSIVPSDVKPML